MISAKRVAQVSFNDEPEVTNLVEFDLEVMDDFPEQKHHSLHCNYSNELYRVAYVKVEDSAVKLSSSARKDRVKFIKLEVKGKTLTNIIFYSVKQK